jgi:hypothetical protein
MEEIKISEYIRQFLCLNDKCGHFFSRTNPEPNIRCPKCDSEDLEDKSLYRYSPLSCRGVWLDWKKMLAFLGAKEEDIILV